MNFIPKLKHSAANDTPLLHIIKVDVAKWKTIKPNWSALFKMGFNGHRLTHVMLVLLQHELVIDTEMAMRVGPMIIPMMWAEELVSASCLLLRCEDLMSAP